VKDVGKLARWRRVGAGIVLAMMSLLFAQGARANGLGGVRSELSGQVVISNVLLAPWLDGGHPALASLQRFQRQTVGRISGFWRLHMVAFLNGAPNSDLVSLVAYDITAPGGRHQVKVFEVPLEGGSRTVQINDLVVSEEMGFQPGHRYELAIEENQPAERKPDVYAKGVVVLK
jgi:hypothetical protein